MSLLLPLLLLANLSGNIQNAYVETMASDNACTYNNVVLTTPDSQWSNCSWRIGTYGSVQNISLYYIGLDYNDLFDYDDGAYFTLVSVQDNTQYITYLCTTDYIEIQDNYYRVDLTSFFKSATFQSGTLYFSAPNRYMEMDPSSEGVDLGGFIFMSYANIRMEDERLNGYEEGLADGYEEGYREGNDYGYRLGLEQGTEYAGSFENFWTSLFNGVSSILDVEIFPNFKLWYILGAPIILSLLAFVVGFFR